MIIEEAILIRAPVEKVWEIFTDLSCYNEWNTVMENPSAEYPHMREGMKFRCALRPFAFPVFIEPFIAEFIPRGKIVLTGSKFGITARHDFIFAGSEQGTTVTSRESFGGITFLVFGFIFPSWRIRELTRALLNDLKKAAELS
jgi:hypothetical protein